MTLNEILQAVRSNQANKATFFLFGSTLKFKGYMTQEEIEENQKRIEMYECAANQNELACEEFKGCQWQITHKDELNEVEQELAQEFYKKALEWVNDSERVLNHAEEEYKEFILRVVSRIEGEFEDAYHKYLSLMYAGEKFDPSVDHNHFSLSIKGEIWDCEFTKK